MAMQVFVGASPILDLKEVIHEKYVNPNPNVDPAKGNVEHSLYLLGLSKMNFFASFASVSDASTATI
jgi:hypothetical protein